jgi:site-specific recombinase XerD
MRKKLPEVLSESEQVRLVDHLHIKAPTKLRKLCLLRVMLDNGLRAAEVLALRRQDIDWRNGKMKIHGKGKKERISYLSDENLNYQNVAGGRHQLRQQNDHSCADGRSPKTDRTSTHFQLWPKVGSGQARPSSYLPAQLATIC